MTTSEYSVRVSVIIPLFNHELFISEAIHSVLNQTFSDFELIIIDDGSSDASVDKVREVDDSRITFLTQKNCGAHKTLNRGIKMAKGEYIAILNSDDVYLPDRLKTCIERLEQDNTLGAVFTHIECIDDKGVFLRYQEEEMDNYYHVNKPDDFDSLPVNEKLLAGNYLFTTSNMVCRRLIFNTIGFFYDLRYVHDYQFFLRLSKTYKVNVIPQYLLKYRFHGNNTLSQNYAESIFETGLVIASHLLESINTIEKEDDYWRVMEQFYRTLNTYTSDRLIITLLLFSAQKDVLSLIKSEQAEPFRQIVLESIVANNEISQRNSWQKEQTDSWWRASQELSVDMEWQKEQTKKWWKTAQELSVDMEWQKEQTEKWWKIAQELLVDIKWQKEQTEKLWKTSQKSADQYKRYKNKYDQLVARENKWVYKIALKVDGIIQKIFKKP